MSKKEAVLAIFIVLIVLLAGVSYAAQQQQKSFIEKVADFFSFSDQQIVEHYKWVAEYYGLEVPAYIGILSLADQKQILGDILVLNDHKDIVERMEGKQWNAPDISQIISSFFPEVLKMTDAQKQKAIAEAKQKYSKYLESLGVEFGDVDIDTNEYEKTLPDVIDPNEYVQAIGLWEASSESTESAKVYYSNGGYTKTVVYPGGLILTYHQMDDGKWSLISEANTIVPILEETSIPTTDDSSNFDDFAGYAPVPRSTPFKLIVESPSGRIWQQGNIFIKLSGDSSDIQVAHMNVPIAIGLMMQGYSVEINYKSGGNVQEIKLDKHGTFSIMGKTATFPTEIKNAKLSGLESVNAIVNAKDGNKFISTTMKFAVTGINENDAEQTLDIGLLSAPVLGMDAQIVSKTSDYKQTVYSDDTGLNYNFQSGNKGKVEVKLGPENPLSQDPKYVADPLDLFQKIQTGSISVKTKNTGWKEEIVTSFLYEPNSKLIITRSKMDPDGNLVTISKREFSQPEFLSVSRGKIINGPESVVASFLAVNEIGSYENVAIAMDKTRQGHEVREHVSSTVPDALMSLAPKVYTDSDGSHMSIVGAAPLNMRTMSIGPESGLSQDEFKALSQQPSKFVEKLIENPSVGGGMVASFGGQLQIGADSLYVKGIGGEFKLDKVTYKVLDKQEATLMVVPGEQTSYRGSAGIITIMATGYNNRLKYDATFTIDNLITVHSVRPSGSSIFGSTDVQDTIMPNTLEARQLEQHPADYVQEQIESALREAERQAEIELNTQIDLGAAASEAYIQQQELVDYEASLLQQFQQLEPASVTPRERPRVKYNFEVTVTEYATIYVDAEKKVKVIIPGPPLSEPLSPVDALKKAIEGGSDIYIENAYSEEIGNSDFNSDFISLSDGVLQLRVTQGGRENVVTADSLRFVEVDSDSPLPGRIGYKVTGKSFKTGDETIFYLDLEEDRHLGLLFTFYLMGIAPSVNIVGNDVSIVFKDINGPTFEVTTTSDNPVLSELKSQFDPLKSIETLLTGKRTIIKSLRDGSSLEFNEGVIKYSDKDGNIKEYYQPAMLIDEYIYGADLDLRYLYGTLESQIVVQDRRLPKGSEKLKYSSTLYLSAKNSEGFPVVLSLMMQSSDVVVFAQELHVGPIAVKTPEGNTVLLFPSGTSILAPAGLSPANVVELMDGLSKLGAGGSFVTKDAYLTYEGKGKTLKIYDGQKIIELTASQLSRLSSKYVTLGELLQGTSYGSTYKIEGKNINEVVMRTISIGGPEGVEIKETNIGSPSTIPISMLSEYYGDTLITSLAMNNINQLALSNGIYKGTGIDPKGNEVDVTFKVISVSGNPTIEILTIMPAQIAGQSEPTPTEITFEEFNPFSIFSPLPLSYRTMDYPRIDVPGQQPYPLICGDGVLNIPEQCESPNTNDNPFCGNNPTVMCLNRKTAIRDIYGKCNSRCGCEYDSPSRVLCVKGLCGANCSNNNDCQSGTLCSQTSCLCVVPPLNGLCGDGIVQSPNNDSINEQCDGDDDVILDDTGFCKTVNKCIECQWQAVLDSSDSQFELCDGIDNNCNNLMDDNIQVTPSQNEEGYCSKQVGVCYNSKKRCNGLAGFAECSIQNYNYTGQYQETESMCDNLDNDCDGSIDEGCPCVINSTKSCGQNNLGVCKLGVQTCSDEGRWGLCEGAVYPKSNKETMCNSIDDDCDGIVDENLKNRCGECGQLPEEVCDYIDNDCDAEMQSPLIPPVQGLCPQDVMQCPDGSHVSRIFPDCKFKQCPIERISLLLHMNGNDGSTTFTDSSPNPKIAKAMGISWSNNFPACPSSPFSKNFSWAGATGCSSVHISIKKPGAAQPINVSSLPCTGNYTWEGEPDSAYGYDIISQNVHTIEEQPTYWCAVWGEFACDAWETIGGGTSTSIVENIIQSGSFTTSPAVCAAFIATSANNAKIDTSQGRFGGSSLFFDGIGGHLTVSDHDDFSFSSGDFTIDFWLRLSSLPSRRIALYSQDNGTKDFSPLAIAFSGSPQKITAFASGSGSSWDVLNEADFGNPDFALNIWHHFAFTRKNDMFAAYVDGKQIGSAAAQGALMNSPKPLYIGGQFQNSSAQGFSGWIDEYRITKGIARWDSEFVPPDSEYAPAREYAGINASNFCPFGTICKGVYADGIDNNANGIIDEGIDEDVKPNPAGNYTNWCNANACTKIKRTCSKLLEDEFRKIYRKKDKSKLEEYIRGSEYFSCPPDDTDAVCCQDINSCVYDGKCYQNGSIEDIGNDGIMDMCIVESPGRWVINYETNCTDGVTNDADPLIDCQDPDCSGLQGPNGEICCNSANDCPQDDCIAESCANNGCALTGRNMCDSAECPPNAYCNATGGDCKTADESYNVCLSCVADSTPASWNFSIHIDAGKEYSNSTNAFNSLFNSDALSCPPSSCSKSNCSCFDSSNSIAAHNAAIATGACCGDDSGEYFKKDYFGGECTNNATDCVWLSGDSQKSNTGNAEWWCYLHEWAQCDNSSIGGKSGAATCAGIDGNNRWMINPAPESQYSCNDLKDNDGDGAADCDDSDCYSALQGKVTDESDTPINGASVIVKKGGNQIASLTTNSQGSYNTSSLACGNYQVSASHYQYATQSRFFTANALQQYNIDIVLGAENSCEADCTLAYDETIHASCANINGCTFYNDKAKEICDFAKPGWARDYNETHYIACASGSPEPKIESKASVSCASGTLVKITRIVLYNGEPVKLVVAACG